MCCYHFLVQEDAASQHGQKGDIRSLAHAGVSRLGMAAAAATKIAVLSVGSHGDNFALNTCLKKLHQLNGPSKVSCFRARLASCRRILLFLFHGVILSDLPFWLNSWNWRNS